MFKVPVRTLAPLAALSLLSAVANAEVVFSEDFDGGGVNSIFSFTNVSGDPGEVIESGLVSQGMVAKLTSISASNNNALAFDSFSLQSEQATITFDFRMSTDAENTGCCVEAADGFGIGFFDTDTYGTTGAINPTQGTTALWEEPYGRRRFPGSGLYRFRHLPSERYQNHWRRRGNRGGRHFHRTIRAERRPLPPGGADV